MKRIKKGFASLIIFALLFTILSPIKVKAESQQTSYINIKDTTKIVSESNLSFSNITFKDYTATSTLSFGLTGVVENSSGSPMDYTTTVYYYDANYNLIAQGYNESTAVEGTSKFNQMSNVSILKGHSINEINYYRLIINRTSISTEESNNEAITPSKTNQYNAYDYVIDKYDVQVEVNENNTLDITETITAYFNVAKHGIFRKIPLKNTITRLDGTTSKNRAQVTNVSVDNEYTVSRENGNYKIQIGSASHTITGEKTYVIKYTYNLGKDPVKEYDELYYNIIGDEWDTVIGNVTFTITMPKEYDSSKLGFSSGLAGSTNNDKVKYNINGNKITGRYNGILRAGEALTVRCELDEGYFVGAGLSINIINDINYLFFLLPIIFLGVAILICYKFGRDEKVIETVEFYPPEGFNSLEVGFLYKGKANKQDVTSLLIYLANKGYIKITEIEEKSLFSTSKSFKITKLKEYDGNNQHERLFLKGLFSKKYDLENNSINEVTSSDLYNHFYITMNKILSKINNKKNKNKIFEKSASNKSIFIILMIIATYIIITFPPIISYEKSFSQFFALCYIIGFTILFNILFGDSQIIYDNDHTIITLLLKIFILILGGAVTGIPWAFNALPTLLQDPIYLIGYIVGVVCALGMVLCLKFLPKRTKYGNEMLGKLRGFKNFLKLAEKEKLEAMVMQDPKYFYNILPYTYVLGVSTTWIKKFETISLQAPSWYESPDAFNMNTFGTFMKHTMDSAQSVMSSSPSSSSGGSSGGGSSGGGSSGGGSGGGGGGSW